MFEDVFSQVDWNVVLTIGLLLINAAVSFFLYRSVPEKTFNQLADFTKEITNRIPGETDDALRAAIVEVLRGILVDKSEDSTTDA